MSKLAHSSDWAVYIPWDGTEAYVSQDLQKPYGRIPRSSTKLAGGLLLTEAQDVAREFNGIQSPEDDAP